jgi:hypothetical protein
MRLHDSPEDTHRTGRPLVRYRITSAIAAVKLEERPGSSLRDPTEILVKIPAGVFVELDGAVAPSGLVTVIWEQDAYAVFYEDLTGVGQVVSDPEKGLSQAP